MTEGKCYLGDGVYASQDGYQVWLTTEALGRTHSIALEPRVLAALAIFVEDCNRRKVPATDAPR
jgi:hypothetical protein